MRAAGIEVWFDKSELRGGDAWDASIRRKIKDCALFVPIISATTENRTEGYFRLEWRLAEQRSHLMAKGRPFLVPVVIDGTSGERAQVPGAFLDVQWSRFPEGRCDERYEVGGFDIPPTPRSSRGWVVGRAWRSWGYTKSTSRA